ncbi:MAG: S41 family peptidase [Ruminiclostridium sp.]
MIIYDILLIALLLISLILLYFLAGYALRAVSSKWRILYAVPGVMCILIAAISGFEPLMLGAYIGSALPLAGFAIDSKKVRRISCIAAAAAVITAIPLCILVSGYRRTDYAADFEKGYAAMKKHYVLGEYKGIDWDALYEKHLPEFMAAQSDTENLAAWLSFCSEFHDGHVAFVPDNYETVSEKTFEELFGNDCGLAFMTLSDGSIAAVNVAEDSEAYKAGIRNGTIITEVDGGSPAQKGKELTKYSSISFADRENEEFYRAIYGGGAEGESMTVSFLDENGAEKTAVLPQIGNYYRDRLTGALEIIDGGIDAGHLTWTEVDEEVEALRIKAMTYDSNSMKSGDFSGLKAGLSEKLTELKAAGVTNLILDMRGNSGGSGDMVKAIAELLAPEGEHFYCIDGKWNDEMGGYLTDSNGFIKGQEHYFTGEDLWAGGKVVILVNNSSISAADHLVSVLSGFPDITVMGFTKSNGSGQGIGGIQLESGMLQFSSSLLLDETGGAFIDCDSYFVSKNSVEVRIPFDKAAVEALFDREEDYLLNKAVEYLKN